MRLFCTPLPTMIFIMVFSSFVKKKSLFPLFFRVFSVYKIQPFKKGEKIQLVGFGTFEVGERAAREGINPRTRETIKIAAAKTPKFKAGKQLKDSLN